MLVALIVACEIGFWVVLGSGLFLRYVLRMRRTSAVVLACTPLVDLVLLIATVIDLRGGATANQAHGLAAVYIGFSVAFGHSMLRWADQRFAHRFAGGPEPTRPPKYGAAKVRHEWREFGKGALGAAVAAGLLLVAIVWIGDASRTEALSGWIVQLGIVLTIWLVAFPLWYSLFPPSEEVDLVASRGL